MKNTSTFTKLFVIFLCFTILFTFATLKISPSAITNKESKTNIIASAINSDVFVKEIIKLCNAERAKKKLAPLIENVELYKLALLKSQDMVSENYFDHKSKVYGTSKDMMKRFKINYTFLGENLGKTENATPAQLVEAWMNSPTHRANILNSNFKLIGVAYANAKDGNVLWTQLFMTP